MKHFIAILIVSLHLSCSSNQQSETHKADLENLWDTLRPIANPDKGWYHHMLDNGVGKYLIQDDKDLTSFPGMDHLYLRLCWAYLEPEEGKYDWSYIDNIVNKYVPMGFQVSFRISCKETGPAPASVPVEIEGVRYATPYWVKLAGAKGIDHPEFGTPSWTPVWDDPIFLMKLDNFHKAFSEKYDGQPWVRYIDVGSIGEWGEGHTHASTRIPPTVEEIKTHMNLYLKHYKKSQLVVTDDLLYWNKPDDDVQELMDYAAFNGFTLRDDSPLVKYYVETYLDTWTVSHPRFFEAVYKLRPTVFELEHYRAVKANGFWLGKNGEDVISGINVSGAEMFRNAMRLIHPTYIGFHGYLGIWSDDNPDLTNELLNLCGYWYFPKSVEIEEVNKSTLGINMEWLNKGVAPAYSEYKMKGKLISVDNPDNAIEFEIEDSGNRNWMPGEVYSQKYEVKTGKKLKGKYRLAIQLFDDKSRRPVDIGLTTDVKEGGYFFIQDIIF